jgi:hypothetical protein
MSSYRYSHIETHTRSTHFEPGNRLQGHDTLNMRYYSKCSSSVSITSPRKTWLPAKNMASNDKPTNYKKAFPIQGCSLMSSYVSREEVVRQCNLAIKKIEESVYCIWNSSTHILKLLSPNLELEKRDYLLTHLEWRQAPVWASTTSECIAQPTLK